MSEPVTLDINQIVTEDTPVDNASEKQRCCVVVQLQTSGYTFMNDFWLESVGLGLRL